MKSKQFERREFLATGAKAGAAMALSAGIAPLIAGADISRPPNVIVILTDDLGWGDLSCYGSEAIGTPNLDRMASEGVRMTDFFSSSPVCSPSRAGLLTGRYPPRTGVTAVYLPSSSPAAPLWNTSHRLPHGLPCEEVIIPQALKPAGYDTYAIGKWHLGDRKKYRPHHRGFDQYCGLLYSNDMKPLRLYRNDEVIEKAPVDQNKLTGTYTKTALEFIDRSASKPFFLYFAHSFPHIPIHASDRFRGKSRGGLYGDAVEEIDWSVGEIMNALDKHGIAENTLIFFTSDNGPWFLGSTGGARGRKGETLDGGMKVPMIARWPGRIPAGKIIEEPSMNIDFFPTALAAAGAPAPTDRIIDGMNILPLLEGRREKTPHEAIYFYWNRELQGVRVGKWKYFRRRRIWMYTPIVKQGPWLIDMEDDPYESYNVIDKYPDTAKKLEQTMIDWEKKFGRGIN